MSDRWSRPDAWWTYPKGSKENPVILGHYEMRDLRAIIEPAEMEYAYADVKDKGVVRAAAREKILTRWPELFDHCHVRYGWIEEKDREAEYFEHWWESLRR